MCKVSIVIKNLLLLELGGFIYSIIEVLYRGNTHWTMFIVGGLCFLLVGWINKFFS